MQNLIFTSPHCCVTAYVHQEAHYGCVVGNVTAIALNCTC